MKLVVGMPVFERSWCIPLWFKSLEAQELAPKKDITLCFAYSTSYDGTYEQLLHYGQEYGDLRIYTFDLPTFPSREDMSRFHTLAALRNALLQMVREVEPDYFLTWDNDVLFEPKVLQQMFIDKDAVGALIDMGGQDEAMIFPSVMEFPGAPGELAFRRPWTEYPHEQAFKCDIIMAVKLMKKDVYMNTEYRWDMVGEDIGWCHSANEKGYERWLQPLAHGVHLYDKLGAINVYKKFKDLSYPEILGPLKNWYRIVTV